MLFLSQNFFVLAVFYGFLKYIHRQSLFHGIRPDSRPLRFAESPDLFLDTILLSLNI